MYMNGFNLELITKNIVQCKYLLKHDNFYEHAQPGTQEMYYIALPSMVNVYRDYIILS